MPTTKQEEAALARIAFLLGVTDKAMIGGAMDGEGVWMDVEIAEKVADALEERDALKKILNDLAATVLQWRGDANAAADGYFNEGKHLTAELKQRAAHDAFDRVLNEIRKLRTKK